MIVLSESRKHVLHMQTELRLSRSANWFLFSIADVTVIFHKSNTCSETLLVSLHLSVGLRIGCPQPRQTTGGADDVDIATAHTDATICHNDLRMYLFTTCMCIYTARTRPCARGNTQTWQTQFMMSRLGGLAITFLRNISSVLTRTDYLRFANS